MKPRPREREATRRRMLAYLRSETICLRDSYREVDGVVRDRRALRDMETIKKLQACHICTLGGERGVYHIENEEQPKVNVIRATKGKAKR